MTTYKKSLGKGTLSILIIIMGILFGFKFGVSCILFFAVSYIMALKNKNDLGAFFGRIMSLFFIILILGSIFGTAI